MSGISEKTFQSWLKTLDPNGIWISDEIFQKVRCAYGVYFVQNTANCYVHFATSATPLSTALLTLLSNVMHCHLKWDLANDH